MLLEVAAPERLGVFHHHADELLELILVGAARRQRLAIAEGRRRAGVLPGQDAQRVDAERYGDHDENDDDQDAAQARPGATTGQLDAAAPAERVGSQSAAEPPTAESAAALGASVLDVGAFLASLPFHGFYTPKLRRAYAPAPGKSRI